jgi:hypothetical protein
MKAYVTGYRSADKEKEPRGKVPPFGLKDNVDVGFHRHAEWRMSFQEEAKAELQILQGMKVHVGGHFCELSIEELPEGDFAIVCLSHPDWGTKPE